MVTIANPIYDIVFKYLLEDERIARIILSALLKKANYNCMGTQFSRRFLCQFGKSSYLCRSNKRAGHQQ